MTKIVLENSSLTSESHRIAIEFQRLNLAYVSQGSYPSSRVIRFLIFGTSGVPYYWPQNLSCERRPKVEKFGP
jgi:hypothetical protein